MSFLVLELICFYENNLSIFNMNTVLPLIILLEFKITSAIIDNPDSIQNENKQLEVRAVIIKCELPEEAFSSDSETVRFQREELFKHNALRDCKKKLVVTLKMSSDPNQASGDEYIPIEHVLGVNKRKIRLLNPYVLRLRRQSPFQAYKLRRIDTVRGVLTKFYQNESVFTYNKSRRIQRDLQLRSFIDEDWYTGFLQRPFFKLDHGNRGHHSYSIKIREMKHPLHKMTPKSKTSIMAINYFDQRYKCPTSNGSTNRSSLQKRLVKDYEYNFASTWIPGEFTFQDMQKTSVNFHKQTLNHINNRHSHRLQYEYKEPVLQDLDDSNNAVNERLLDNTNKIIKSINLNVENEVKKLKDTSEMKHELTRGFNKKDTNYYLKNKSDSNNKNVFALYEIGDPVLWFTAQIQLFEKLSNSEGKTTWNDLTKDEIASVSTANPEWSNGDLNVQYKSAEFIAREEFKLPFKGLCLVVPLRNNRQNPFKDKSGEFIIIPAEDVIRLDNKGIKNRREDNATDHMVPTDEVKREILHLVTIRTTRALMEGGTDSLIVISRGTDKYLKLPHSKPHYAQVNLEARADDNELILVGVLGRLTTIVSDTTRKTRSILTVQATNTGLAAARLRVSTRECNPELFEAVGRDETVAGPILLPPRHTENFQLNLPLQIPIENTNCIVALVNENDESIAVRDVRIKYGDRCFCVWHCDCVCLSEDPKLLCRDMTPAQLSAAGLSTQHESRHARSVCYPDVVTLNLFVTFIGVLLALFLLGTVKAILGLIFRCVESWGLQLLLQMPRKLDHYYECLLRDRRVEYDSDGWPIHPDTKERTVRLVSKPMEFILNLIFFITLPCILIWEAMKKLASCCQAVDGRSDVNYRKNGDKNCFSSHNVQDMEMQYRRRRGGLRRWMTPHAEELSAGIWQEGLTPIRKISPDCLRPLLREETCLHKPGEQSSFVDSEQDDTEYVLMQMQKSRESIARSQEQQERQKDIKNKCKNSNNAGSKKHY